MPEIFNLTAEVSELLDLLSLKMPPLWKTGTTKSPHGMFILDRKNGYYGFLAVKDAPKGARDPYAWWEDRAKITIEGGELALVPRKNTFRKEDVPGEKVTTYFTLIQGKKGPQAALWITEGDLAVYLTRFVNGTVPLYRIVTRKFVTEEVDGKKKRKTIESRCIITLHQPAFEKIKALKAEAQIWDTASQKWERMKSTEAKAAEVATEAEAAVAAPAA
jgi:hypothetical protein